MRHAPTSRRATRTVQAVLALALVGSTVALVAGAQRSTSSVSAATQVRHFAINVDDAGVALHGHDPVSYFTDSKPQLGNAAFTATHEGATYRFASASHRDAFVAAPAKYIPQYGGYCAMGVTGGAKYDIDPSAWRIEDGKLFLNKNPSVQKSWLKDIPGNITKADSKWPKILGDTPKGR